MYITIDRFEGEYAVIETENGEIYNIPRAIVPDAVEGNVINIYVDNNRTKKNEDEVCNLVNELFKD